MKSTQLPSAPSFKPIQLTLETQAEVDAIYFLFNHYYLAKALGIDVEQRHELYAFRVNYHSDLYDKVNVK